MNLLLQSFLLTLLAFSLIQNGNGTINSSPSIKDQVKQCGINDAICKKLDNEKVQKSISARNEYVKKNEQCWAKFATIEKSKFEVDELGIDKKEKFKKFFAVEIEREEFLDVFIYLTGLLKKPICLTSTTIKSIAALNGQENLAMDYLVNRLEDRAKKSRALRRIDEQKATHEEEKAQIDQQKPIQKEETAFLFGQKGITTILVKEDGLKCEESLLNPRRVINLIDEIISALENYEKNLCKKEKNGCLTGLAEHFKNKIKLKEDELDSFYDRIDGVVKELKNGNKINEKWIEEFVEEWHKIHFELEVKKIGKGFKHFAIWLIKPSHVEDVIQIILFLTGLAEPVEISILALHVFGLDDKFAEAIEKMGAKIAPAIGANDGTKRLEVVKWAFGPNGVAPLFVRGGAKSADGENENFEKMIEEEKVSHAEHQKEREAEIEFLKMIIEEVIKHKGKPMHELMDHVIEKFHNTENKLTVKWQTKMGKWKQGWAEFKSRSVKQNVKNFALWLFTPERINNVIMLIFAITDLETPVYLTLETLEAFGITHLLLGGMEKATRKMDKFYKRHPNATNKVGKQFVEFMIGKEGVIPLFLGDGAFDENDARKNRLEDEANIIEIVASVVKKKAAAGQIIGDLFKWLLEKVQDKGFYLQVLQRWNETMRKLHEKLKNTNILKEAIEKNKEDEKEEETEGGGKTEEEKEKKEVQNVVAKIENREIVKGPYCIKTLFQAIFIWIKAIGKKNEPTINGVNHNQFKELVNKNMAHIVEKNAPKNESNVVSVKKESKSNVNHTVAVNGNHSPRNVANGNGFRKGRL